MLTISATLNTFNRGSVSTRSWTSVTLSYVAPFSGHLGVTKPHSEASRLLTNSDLNLMPVRISYLIEVPIPYIQLLKIILFRHNYAHTYIFAVKITKQKKKKRFIWLPSRLENNYEISAKPNLSMEVRCISNNICIRFINFQISCFTLCNIFAVRMAEGAYS